MTVPGIAPIVGHPRRPNGWGRKLSHRQVKRRIGIGQRWMDMAGRMWTVR